MSSDELGDRTQRPTDRRRREARARGEVARSGDLVSALVLLTASAALWWLGPGLAGELAELVKSGLSTAPTSLDEELIAAQMFQIATRLSAVVLPTLLLVLAAATFANLLQTGFLWVPSAVLPQLDRLDPARAFGRWWSIHSWIGLFWSLVRLVALLGVLLVYARARMGSAGPLVEGSPQAIRTLAAQLIGELAVVLSLSLVAMALIDFGLQFWRLECQLMMTIEEVRREQREDQTNPEVKRRHRAMAASGGVSAAGDVDGMQPV